MNQRPSRNLFFTAEERDKAVHLLGLLIRWANSQERGGDVKFRKYYEERELNQEEDFLTLNEDEIPLEDEGTLIWKKEKGLVYSKRPYKLNVKVKSKAVLVNLCDLYAPIRLTEKDIQTILNEYCRTQTVEDNSKQITFLGILTDNRKLDKQGKTRKPPDFTLELWSRRVSVNCRELEELWRNRYRDVNKKEMPESDKPLINEGARKPAPEEDDSTVTSPIEVMTMTPSEASQIVIQPRSLNPGADSSNSRVSLSNQDRKILQEIIQSVYLRRADFEAFVRDEFDKKLENLAGTGIYKNQVSEFVYWACQAVNRAKILLIALRDAEETEDREDVQQVCRDLLFKLNQGDTR